MQSVRQYSFWSTYDLNRISGHNSDPLSKAESNDSLSSYEGPKMGEPGRPGTRDLDWSIKKLNIRKQVKRKNNTSKKIYRNLYFILQILVIIYVIMGE